MAWYDTNKPGGHKGSYGMPEQGYGRNAYPEHVHRPMVVQYEHHNAQRYEYQAEQVEYRRGSGGYLGDRNGSPRAKDGCTHHGMGNKPHLAPWKPTHDWSDSGKESSPKGRNYEKTKGGSPRYFNAPHGLNNHPFGRHNSSSSGEDDDDSGSDYEKGDVVCEGDVCYPNPNPRGNRAKPNNHFKDDGYDKPKAKPTYRVPQTIPHLTQPSKDPYHEKSSNPRYYESPNRNTHSTPAYGTAPVTAHNGKPTYYEREQPPNKPLSRNPLQNERKPRDEGHKGTITSTEAKKRYGGVTVPTEPKYNGTIDCKEAAEKYKGIFVPGNNF